MRTQQKQGERGGSVVECRTPEREVRGSRPTAAVLCPWARHFTPRKYWLITQEAMAPSRHDWKIVDWDVKPQHNQNQQKQRVATDTWRSLGCRTTPLEYGAKWSVCPAKTQISFGICPVWSDSLLSAWRQFGYLPINKAHTQDWSDWVDVQDDLCLLGAQVIFSFVMLRLN